MLKIRSRFVDVPQMGTRTTPKIIFIPQPRLVQQASASDDAEASFISKLRAMCGYEYTNKLQRMFTDQVRTSKCDFFEEFNFFFYLQESAIIFPGTHCFKHLKKRLSDSYYSIIITLFPKAFSYNPNFISPLQFWESWFILVQVVNR